MAKVKRNNRFARWTVILATGLAAAGFWSGIINGPQPAQSASTSALAAQQASTGFQGGVVRQTPSFSPPPGFSSPQFSSSPPRFQTRGS